MKKVIASAGLLALGALSAQTTKAQMVAGAEKPWSISATLRGFYDDNYDTQPNGPQKKGSAGFEIRPSADVNFVRDTTTINLQYIYSYMYFDARPNGKADQSHDVELFLNHAFNERYSVDLSDSFVIAQEPAIIDPNLSAVDRANGDNLRNTAAINFHAEITRLFSIVLGYSNTYYDYSQDASNTSVPGTPSYSALLDRDENYAHLDTRWTVSDTSTAILGYMFGAVGYLSNESIAPGNAAPGTPGYIAPDVRNSFSHFIYVGLDHSFRSDLTVSIRGGVQILEYPNQLPGNPSSTTDPYVDASLNWTYMDGGVLSAGLHNAHNATDVGSTFVAGTASVTTDQESTTFFVNVAQSLKPLSPKLVANGSFQYQYSTFNGGQFNSEHDIFYLVGLNLTYQFTRYISAEVGYNYDLLDSDIAGRGYDRNRVYAGFTATY